MSTRIASPREYALFVLDRERKKNPKVSVRDIAWLTGVSHTTIYRALKRRETEANARRKNG